MSKMLPGSRPKMTRDEVIALLTDEGVTLGNEVIGVGIRGYFKDSMGKPGVNDINIYDDALFVLSPSVFRSFNFNTDPARSGRKLAMLKPGVYTFYKGKHKRKYDALRPYPEGVKLPCTRDGVSSMCSHTNIHMGGSRDTYSEGCQTTPPEQYDEEMDLIYAQMDKYGQKTIKYVLIER